MKLRAPSPIIAAKRPARAGSVRATASPGRVLETRTVVKKEKDGTETPVWEKSASQEVPTPAVNGIGGISGVALGLTIPGPSGSYRMARVDVSCYLPHGPSDAEAKAAIARASEICSERLGAEAEEAVAALEGR